MSTSGLPTPRPTINPETKPFWDATTEGRFLLKRCRDCSSVIWYPRQLCAECGSLDTEWFESSGRGRIYTYTINRRGEGVYRDAGAFVIAYVELDEGPRVLTNIVTDDLDALAVDKRVEVVFEPASEDAAVYRFRLTDV